MNKLLNDSWSDLGCPNQFKECDYILLSYDQCDGLVPTR